MLKSSSANFRGDLKRLHSRPATKSPIEQNVPHGRREVGLSNTESTADLNKIVAAEITEVLNRAATEIASYNGEIESETIDMIIEIFVNQVTSTLKMIAEIVPNDHLSCTYCSELFFEPSTLRCGHTFCKKCVRKQTICKVCKTEINKEPLPSANILLKSTAQKMHSIEYLCRSVISEGDELMEKEKYPESLLKYMDAIEFNVQSNEALLGRAKAFKALGNIECAVQDALDVPTFSRSSAEVLLTKSQILLSGKKECEALASLLACLTFDSTNTEALSLTKELINKALSKYFWCEPDDSKKRKIDSTESECHSKWQNGKLMETLLSVLIRDIDNSLLSAVNFDNYLENDGKGNKQLLSVGRTFDRTTVESSDFECSLCMMVFFNPVCTPCGHSFCRECLERTMDHRNQCPLCKNEISPNVTHTKAPSLSLDMTMESIIQQLFPNECKERLVNQEKEIDDLRSCTPVFVCTLAFPSMPCPLHIFEPRYRLLIRRALDIHDKQFGISMPDDKKPFQEYGAIVKIDDVAFLSDGRSIVKTVGFRRFKALSYGMKDGYNTAKVQYLSDEPVEKQEDKVLLLKLSVLVYKEAEAWYANIENKSKECIKKHFGDFPHRDEDSGPDGPKWPWWLVAVLPVDDTIKRTIFSKTSLKERLLTIHRILTLLKKNAVKM